MTDTEFKEFHRKILLLWKECQATENTAPEDKKEIKLQLLKSSFSYNYEQVKKNKEKMLEIFETLPIRKSVIKIYVDHRDLITTTKDPEKYRDQVKIIETFFALSQCAEIGIRVQPENNGQKMQILQFAFYREYKDKFDKLYISQKH